MIIKFIVLAIILFIVYTLFFKKSREGVVHKQKNEKKRQQLSDDMVECTHCGVFVALDESLIRSQKYYCCSECANKG